MCHEITLVTLGWSEAEIQWRHRPHGRAWSPSLAGVARACSCCGGRFLRGTTGLRTRNARFNGTGGKSRQCGRISVSPPRRRKPERAGGAGLAWRRGHQRRAVRSVAWLGALSAGFRCKHGAKVCENDDAAATGRPDSSDEPPKHGTVTEIRRKGKRGQQWPETDTQSGLCGRHGMA